MTDLRFSPGQEARYNGPRSKRYSYGDHYVVLEARNKGWLNVEEIKVENNLGVVGWVNAAYFMAIPIVASVASDPIPEGWVMCVDAFGPCKAFTRYLVAPKQPSLPNYLRVMIKPGESVTLLRERFQFPGE